MAGATLLGLTKLCCLRRVILGNLLFTDSDTRRNRRQIQHDIFGLDLLRLREFGFVGLVVAINLRRRDFDFRAD